MTVSCIVTMILRLNQCCTTIPADHSSCWLAFVTYRSSTFDESSHFKFDSLYGIAAMLALPHL